MRIPKVMCYVLKHVISLFTFLLYIECGPQALPSYSLKCCPKQSEVFV